MKRGNKGNFDFLEHLVKQGMPDQMLLHGDAPKVHNKGVISIFRSEDGTYITPLEYRKLIKHDMERELGRVVSKKELNVEWNRRRKFREENDLVNKREGVAELKGHRPISMRRIDP